MKCSWVYFCVPNNVWYSIFFPALKTRWCKRVLLYFTKVMIFELWITEGGISYMFVSLDSYKSRVVIWYLFVELRTIIFLLSGLNQFRANGVPLFPKNIGNSEQCCLCDCEYSWELDLLWHTVLLLLCSFIDLFLQTIFDMSWNALHLSSTLFFYSDAPSTTMPPVKGDVSKVGQASRITNDGIPRTNVAVSLIKVCSKWSKPSKVLDRQLTWQLGTVMCFSSNKGIVLLFVRGSRLVRASYYVHLSSWQAWSQHYNTSNTLNHFAFLSNQEAVKQNAVVAWSRQLLAHSVLVSFS